MDLVYDCEIGERISFIVPGNNWAYDHEGREKIDFKDFRFINKTNPIKYIPIFSLDICTSFVHLSQTTF